MISYSHICRLSSELQTNYPHRIFFSKERLYDIFMVTTLQSFAALTISCINFFFVAMIKYHDQRQLIEEKTYLNFQFQETESSMARKAWNVGSSRKAAGHIESLDRNQKENRK